MQPGEIDALAGELAVIFARTAAANDRSGAPPLASIEAARERGATALTVPAALGGWGANLEVFARWQERIASGDGSTALVLAMHGMLIGGEAESGLWPADAFAELCDAAVTRGALVNAAATEPGAGSPSHGGLPTTVAVPMGAGWSLTGRKSYTTGAPLLSFLRVAARVDGDGEPYSSRFLVRLPAPGVSILDDWDPVGLKPSAGQDILLQDTPGTHLYREDQRGCEGNVWFQVAVAATYLGIGQAASHAAFDYARDHAPPALGKPIADIDAVRLRLGRMRAELLVAQRFLMSVCHEWTQTPGEARPALVAEVSLAKVVATNAAASAADQAMRIAGAAGLSRSLPFERFVRETRAGLAHPPVDDVAHLVIAAELLEG